MEDSDQSRQQGIEFGDLPEDLEEASYPLSKDDLFEQYGDRELTYPTTDSMTVQETLEPVGVEEFESADDVLETLTQMSDRDAVGEAGQTGRGTSDVSDSDEESEEA